MTLKQVGALSGLSTPFLSQVEHDKVQPAVTSLAGIAKALGVTMNYFVDVPSAAATFRTPKEVQTFKLNGGSEGISRLASRFDGRQLEPLLVRIPPGGGVPKFEHAGEEFFYILRGRLTVSVGKEKRVLGAGSSAHHRSTITHGWRNEGKSEVVLVWVGTPPLF